MNAEAAEGAAARGFVALQHLLPQHALSRLVHRITRSRVRPLKDLLISAFIGRYHPDLRDAVQPDPLEFASFNDFFTRALRPAARPIDPDPKVLVSPVDGTVSQLGLLEGSWLVQAKGHAYTVESLLAGEPAWSTLFAGGAYATLYLAPSNYHRVHMPLAGSLRAAWYVPGQLFSVNPTTAASIPGLFARNERVVGIFENGTLSFALVLIGALLVGSLSTVWHGEVTPRRPRGRTALALAASLQERELAKGAEMGRFNMGSTVVVLLPRGRCEWLPALAPGSAICVGEALARLR